MLVLTVEEKICARGRVVEAGGDGGREWWSCNSSSLRLSCWDREGGRELKVMEIGGMPHLLLIFHQIFPAIRYVEKEAVRRILQNYHLLQVELIISISFP